MCIICSKNYVKISKNIAVKKFWQPFWRNHINKAVLAHMTYAQCMPAQHRQ